MTAPRLRGVVLAGGQSSRMGRDKAGVTIGARSLLETAVTAVRAAVGECFVAVRPDQSADPLRQPYPRLFDVADRPGPAGGLLAAAAHDPTAAWLVLACDMPAVTDEWLRVLVASRDPAAGATAWRSAVTGGPEPLCAIWEPATLATLARIAAAQGGHVSPLVVLAGAGPKLLDAPEAGTLGSLNTPAELSQYQEQLHARTSR
jgi:molybdopterin-guanine dinucleotide biosynthesis protein A